MALLRIISPVNRGPQRATARRQYIGSCLPQEAEAPTQEAEPPDKCMKRSGSLNLFIDLLGRDLAA